MLLCRKASNHSRQRVSCRYTEFRSNRYRIHDFLSYLCNFYIESWRCSNWPYHGFSQWKSAKRSIRDTGNESSDSSLSIRWNIEMNSSLLIVRCSRVVFYHSWEKPDVIGELLTIFIELAPSLYLNLVDSLIPSPRFIFSSEDLIGS